MVSKTGRPRKIGPEHHAILRALVTAKPLASMSELVTAFAKRTGIRVHRNTLADALAEAGITRHYDPRSGAEKEQEVTTGRVAYGYTAAHREAGSSQSYASSLTDAEWALVADIFETEGGRGKPPAYSRRLLVDACCYVVRTGCAWRMLPADFPPWQNVYRTFRRWMHQGKFEAMHDRLRAQWRARLGRETGPTASVIDAQSTRSSPQGGDTGYDAGNSNLQ